MLEYFKGMPCNWKSVFPRDSGNEAAVKLCGGWEQTALLQAALTESLADCYVPWLKHLHTAKKAHTEARTQIKVNFLL